MREITALHYVPKPGGGLATPGEILEQEDAARFSEEQIQRLLRAGAIRVERLQDAPARPCAPAPKDEEAPAPEGAREPEKAPEGEEIEAEEAEPPEIDIMDGIIRDEAESAPARKPRRAGRRKAE